MGITRGDGSDWRRRDVECADGALDSAFGLRKEKLKKAGIPPDFEVRGEMLMPLAAFRKAE